MQRRGRALALGRFASPRNRRPGSDRGQRSLLSDVTLLAIGTVGPTVAPWRLFFQQSSVIDRRIAPRFISYERADLWIGIGFVMIGAIAMMAFAAQVFAGRPGFSAFTDAGGIAAGLEVYAGGLPAVLFAIALIDASAIGAMAVSLSTAYAIGDVMALAGALLPSAAAFLLLLCNDRAESVDVVATLAATSAAAPGVEHTIWQSVAAG